VRSLDGRPLVVGRVGADEAGERLVALLRDRGMDTTRIWRDPACATPVKRRTLAGSAHSVKQQIVRVDRGGGPPVAPGSPLLAAVDGARAAVRGALVSDYSLGLLHPGTIPPLIEALRGARLPICVDSRSQLRLFRGATAATPNLQEAEAFAGSPVGDDRGRLERAGESLRESLAAATLVLTRGSQGMSVFTADAPPVHLPVYGTDEVADVTGAGDTVIATLSIALAAGVPAIDAARIANYAGGIVVMKRGTATVSREEIRRAIAHDPALEGPPA
jgi:rfaE bifunctional protein kinase chain/domain